MIRVYVIKVIYIYIYNFVLRAWHMVNTRLHLPKSWANSCVWYKTLLNNPSKAISNVLGYKVHEIK